MLGAGLPRVHPALSPARVGGARRRGDPARLARGDARGAGRARASARSASASPTSARPSCCGTARTLAPVAPAIVWQDRRTSERCRELRETGRRDAAPRAHRARRRSLLLRHQARVAAARPAICAAGPSAGELAAGTVESWLVARLTGGRAHVTDHTNASRTLLYGLAARDWDPELLAALRRAARAAAATSCRRPAPWRETDAGACWACSLPIAGLAGDQQAALFGQGCCRDGHGQEHLRHRRLPAGVHRRRACRRRRTGVLATAACGPRGEPAYALEGSVFIAGAAVQWLRDGLGLIASAAETEALARSVPDTGGVHFVPGVRRAGHAALGGGGAGDHHRAHPRDHAGAPGARGARGDGVQQRRAARGDGGVPAASRSRCSGWTAARRPTTG